MVHRKKIISVLFILAIQTDVATAGLWDLTVHSRANCGNNESISWQRGRTYTLLTVSEHLIKGKVAHPLNTGWEYTWRSAAVHWGEAGPGAGWRVKGGHYMRVGSTEYNIGFTDVTDCSIYNGWWD